MGFQLPAIAGLTALITPPSGNGQIGDKFATPPGFDKQKYASRWAIDGPEVQEAQQDEVLSYANARAQGWAIWMQETEDGKKKTPYKRVVGKHCFILMFRPIELQRAVTLCYAAESRARVNLNLTGEENAANADGDPGILSGADLKKYGKLSQDEDIEILPTTHIGPKPDTTTTMQLQ